MELPTPRVKKLHVSHYYTTKYQVSFSIFINITILDTVNKPKVESSTTAQYLKEKEERRKTKLKPVI
jgi:hypothetical protein